MLKIKVIPKIIVILIFMQLSLGLAFATGCVEDIGNGVFYYDQKINPENSNEFLIILNNNKINNTDLSFIKVKPLPVACQNKIFVLEISMSDLDFNISGNKTAQYINGVDILRIKKDINFTIDNADGGVTNIYLGVPKVEIDGNVTLLVTDDSKRESGNNTLKLKINELLVKENSKLQLKMIGDTINMGNTDKNYNGTDVGLNITMIDNKGILLVSLIGGNGGTRKIPFYGNYYFGGDGGSVFDLNISRFINNGRFDYNSTGGIKGRNDNPSNYINKAGDVGSVNIDYLYNGSPDFSIRTKINEHNIENLSSVSCGCLTVCSTATDPKIGNINIKYLATGSFLPKTLEIIKNAVYTSNTKIDINGCHAASSGNSNISYKADDLVLRLANLGIIQNDFDNSESEISNIYAEETTCPVCDSLELNNFALRTDTEYTIYTDQTGVISDLNIYYLNPDNSLFKPPGYPEDKNYVVYSLRNGETISPISKHFMDTNIKEYEILKEKLYYNPEEFNLNDIPTNKGYGIGDVRLFCQGQRYLLKFKIGNQIKQIPFTPIFDIK